MEADVMNEILNVLKSIDGRLERIEEELQTTEFEKVVRQMNDTIMRPTPSPLRV